MTKAILLHFDSYDCIRLLATAQKGKLLEALFQYATNKTIPELDELTNMVFTMLKNQHDRDAAKYAKVCEKNKNNANKRWHNLHATACDRMPSDAVDANRDRDRDRNNNTTYVEATSTEPTESPKKAVRLFVNASLLTGNKYTPAWGRDCKLMNTLLKGGAVLSDIEAMAVRFFSPEHTYKGNYDVPSFFKAFNRLKNMGNKADPLLIRR